MAALDNIPRVGNKTITAIESQIPPQELNSFYTELQTLQFHRLFTLGLDTKIEQEIIKYFVSKYYQFEYAQDLLQSSHVKKMFSELLSLLRRQFLRESNKRELIFFTPTTNATEIARRQKIVSRAISFFSQYTKEQIQQMRKLLAEEKKKKNEKYTAIVLCDEEELFLKLKQTLPKTVTLVCLHSREEFEHYQHYDLIRYVYSDESSLICDVEEADNVLSIKWRGKILEVLPELLWEEFLTEKQSLDCVLQLIQEFGIPSDPIELEVLQSVIESLEKESSLLEPINRRELEKLRDLAESYVEEELGKTQIKGTELLKLLKSPVSEHLLLRKVVESVKEKLATEHTEASKLLSFETIIPELDEEALQEHEEDLARNVAERQFLKYKDFCLRFLSQRQILHSAQSFLERIDFLLGVGEFFAESSEPRINNNKRFSCMNLLSTTLSTKERGIQAITYYLDRSQTILTGANSGGKTSLLNLLLETQLLTQMGLYVKGAAQVRLYDQIHFFSKSSGTVGSGAFETTLKDLAKIADSNPTENREQRALVLLDEIESITEPGAAGKLISATLEWFEQQEDIDVVLVSHLGDVLQELCPHARIDGIEAVSLDDSLQLVVDRNPKIGVLARSTPQLIVQKLALQDRENAYFAFLQEKMSVKQGTTAQLEQERRVAAESKAKGVV